ncbi:MAG TPA: phosphopantetheine-binding protein [Polyangiaceae bacterium]|nr:phosphopantetheine-binding protein [Polyangiaceae bacterium]
MQEYKKTVRDFIAQVANGRSLTDTDDIFTLGIVNSMFALQLVQFVEREFDVVVDNDDLDVDNFRTIDRIADFVQRKATGSAGSQGSSLGRR